MYIRNVKLIFLREMRDQLRDRRTLFLIGVLPLLLYPLLGTSFFQISQFLQHHAAEVMVVGAEEIEDSDWLPPLIVDNHFEVRLFTTPSEQEKLLIVSGEKSDTAADTTEGESPTAAHPASETDTLTIARRQLALGKIQAVLYFPPGFTQRLSESRQALIDRSGSVESDDELALPEPQIFFNSANEKSQLAQMRLERLLQKWRSGVMRTNLLDSDVPLEAVRPFELQPQDVAKQRQRQAAIWSKILPFILLIWALTGAFYPAVDLCAGEKERGTLETLLASPASRREIVWGKLLTVMTFSIVTALLSLGSLGLTGKFIMAQLKEVPNFSEGGPLAMPPLISVVWLTIALIPLSALFSALCLACASFARSTKEGQYYLMPLLLITMPLMMLPLAPGVELNLGNSLIPLTGVVLLLRSFIEGQYWQALPYVVPVVGVTLICCLLAIRWAEEQFNSESVLFREGERLDLRRWLVHLVRDRGDTPTFGQAILCVAAITVVQFFINLAMAANVVDTINFAYLGKITFISQVVCIALPAALMTLLFTGRPRKTLMLDRLPRVSHVVLAAMLALFTFPLGLQFQDWVQRLYPYTPEVLAQTTAISEAILNGPNWYLPLLLIAVLPACCEEVAYRGFILSGLRHLGHKWWAIGLSAIAFGLAHFFLQQKISAAAVGVIIGVLAVQTGSLIPCIVFHALYNSLSIGMGYLARQFSPEALGDSPWQLIVRNKDSLSFQPIFLLVCAAVVVAILRWLHRAPYRRTDEEQLQEARDRQLTGA